MGRYSGHYEYISQLQFASTDVHCQLVETQGKSFIKNSSPSVSENVCQVPLVNEQVCVQLPTLAVFVALPALLLARRAAAPSCYGAGCAAIDRCLLPAGPTAANPPHAAAAVG